MNNEALRDELLRELHAAQKKHFALFPELGEPIDPMEGPGVLTSEQEQSLVEYGAFITDWRRRWREALGVR